MPPHKYPLFSETIPSFLIYLKTAAHRKYYLSTLISKKPKDASPISKLLTVLLEVLGALLYPLRDAPDSIPLFVNMNSHISLSTDYCAEYERIKPRLIFYPDVVQRKNGHHETDYQQLGEPAIVTTLTAD